MPDSFPPTPPPPLVPKPPAVPAPGRFTFQSLEGGAGAGNILGALLKRPGSLIYQLHQPGAQALFVVLAVSTALLLTFYGLTIGSFSGGTQWWAAPLKTVVGTFLSAAICLPSLYIFANLSGGEVKLAPLCGVLLATLCLNALLLVGFAPVAWVFSQSTDSVAFMGFMHLFFWLISMVFALRLLAETLTFLKAREGGYLQVWFIIFLPVCLQMTTALRPFIGRSDTLLPKEKMSFLGHWVRSLGDSETASYSSSSPAPSPTPAASPSPSAPNAR